MVEKDGSGARPAVLALNEGKLSLVGKLFLAGTAAWLLGRATNLKLRGTQREIEALVNVLKSSKEFQYELAKPGASVHSVMQKLGMKHLAARDFERVTGVPFPL